MTRSCRSPAFFVRESALREVQLIPALEGSTQINFALTAQFVANYFAGDRDVASPAQLRTVGLVSRQPGKKM